jgi:hypothetical protein
VLAAVMLRGAVGRVGGVHLKLVLLDAAGPHVVQVAVVQVVHVPVVSQAGVAAAGAVLVIVVRVRAWGGQESSSFFGFEVVREGPGIAATPDVNSPAWARAL